MTIGPNATIDREMDTGVVVDKTNNSQQLLPRYEVSIEAERFADDWQPDVKISSSLK